MPRRPRPKNEPASARRGRRAACAPAALALLFCLLPGCRADGAGGGAPAQVAAALADLDREVASSKLSEEEKRQKAAAVRAARSALEEGRVYVSLERLRGPWVEAATRRYLEAHAEAGRGGAEVFEREWRRVGGELEERERRLAAPAGAGLPAAALALAEASEGQARRLYNAGRLYGLNTTPESGLYYLGLAPAHLDFALFCRGLRFDAAGRPAPARDLGAELRSLEGATLAAYRRAEAEAGEANERQGLFNLANSTLKLAAQLNEEGRRAGALHKYLEATLLLGLAADAQAPAPGDVARLRSESAAVEKRLRAAGEDHSLGLLFWEPAHGTLAADAPSAEELKRAAAVIRRVMPAYFGEARADAPGAAARAGAGNAAGGEARAAGKKVKVTLVRWPYT